MVSIELNPFVGHGELSLHLQDFRIFLNINIYLVHYYFWQGNQTHFKLAQLFDKPCFLGLLAVKVLIITGIMCNLFPT